MGIIVSVASEKEKVSYFCDRCKQENFPEEEIVHLTARKDKEELAVWDLCPDCYSEVLDGAISPYLQS